jgi:hypothetical protein
MAAFRGAGVEPMCRKERGTFVSPARAVPQESAISAPSLFLEWKIISSAHSAKIVKMHYIL